MTFEEARAGFNAARPRVPSLPITGVIVYSSIAFATLLIAPQHRNLALFVGFWAILPIASLIARLRGEPLAHDRANPLNRLSELMRMMVLATWGIHIPVWLYAPDLFPLTVGIAFGLHWIVFSWCTGTNVGFIHLPLRVALVLAAWFAFPANRVGAVCVGVALSYLASVIQMARRPRA